MAGKRSRTDSTAPKAAAPKATTTGFRVRAVRQGIDPTGTLRDRGDEFFLSNPKFFSDASVQKVRHGKNTGVFGWMERVDGNAAPVAAPPVEDSTTESDVI